MDIDLLSKMVKELILDNDKVVLPGLGAFVAEIVPSTFSDKGYTINPPYRKLYFRAKPDEGNALALFYAESNGVDIDMAEMVISDFVSELKSVLYARKTVVFPGLGRLRATKENTVFFVADEDLDIYPEGFALESISMKTHVETQDEVRTFVEELKSIVEVPVEVELSDTESVSEPIPEPMPESEPLPEPEQTPELEPLPEPEPMPVPSVRKELQRPKGPTLQEILEQEAAQRKRMTKMFLYGVLIFVVVLFLAFVISARLSPGIFDDYLYTPEELEIINRK